MFVTSPGFEQIMPQGFTDPENKYWRTLRLSLETAWYLFVFASERPHETKTALVAWEGDLLVLLTSPTNARPKAIGRMDKATNGGRWDLRWMTSVWLATSEEAEDIGHFVFLLEGEKVLRDDLLQEVEPRIGRPLLFRSDT